MAHPHPPGTRALRGGLHALAEATRCRDEATQSHNAEVGRLAMEMGRRLDLDAEALELLFFAGLLHDLGKIGVPDDVLWKAGPLTEGERRRMERHPILGAEILRALPGAEALAEIILSHHECPDGSGYPRGLSGEALPTEAKVLHVADCFCALVERRPYKAPMAEAEALSRMRDLAGPKLEARCLGALEGVLRGPSSPPVEAAPG